MRSRVKVQAGPSTFNIYTWQELWNAMFHVLAWTMEFEVKGRCKCGCDVADCDYCVWECL